jgi:hypothetical protein
VAKILDFGLARYDNTRLTRTGYLSGTIAYMSPERFSGETGPADDIFALGAVAYEFLTYQRAFAGDTTPHVISKILGGTLPPDISTVTEYPAQLDELVNHALQRDPLDRYRSAYDFEAALNDFLRSPAYSEFAAKETAQPDYSKVVDWSDESSKSAPNPYSSGYSLAAAAVEGAPTIRVANDEQSGTQAEMEKLAAEPTIVKTTSGRPGDFQIPDAAEGRPSRRVQLAIAAGVVVIAIAGGALLLRPEPPPPKTDPKPEVRPPVVQTQPQTPTAVVTEATSRESEVQLATASTLATLVAQRQLNASERRRLDEANRRLEEARERIGRKDYAAGNALIGDVTVTLREMLAAPPRPEPAPGKKRPAPPTTTGEPEPQPPIVVPLPPAPSPQPPAPVPAPVPQPVPPPKPARAELEREIQTFMRAVAVALQEKDVSFFRQNSLRFNEQQAAAIRNSPSQRVEIAVRDIQFVDDDRVRVRVRRTDTFAEAGLPPGVQSLVYELQKVDGGWKITALTRE